MTSPRLLVTFAGMLFWCTAALAQVPAGPPAKPAAPSDRAGYVLPDGTGKYYLAFRMGEEEREARAKAKDAAKQEAGT